MLKDLLIYLIIPVILALGTGVFFTQYMRSSVRRIHVGALIKSWRDWLFGDPKRLCGILLFSERNDSFRTYVDKSTGFIEELAGKACQLYIIVDPKTDSPLVKPAHALLLEAGADELADAILKKSTVLPGICITPSLLGKKCKYYPCANMTEDKLSEFFQLLFQRIQIAYRERYNRHEVFERLLELDRSHAIKTLFNNFIGSFKKDPSKALKVLPLSKLLPASDSED
jgi:hypothetical protein